MIDENIISEENIHIYQEWDRLEEEVENATPETLEEKQKALKDFLKKHPDLPAKRKI
ncbi:TPA: hypothetical protein KKW64_001554 [Legionella pneumophila]|nr:hypothetical protein [Legionella pneumophila]